MSAPCLVTHGKRRTLCAINFLRRMEMELRKIVTVKRIIGMVACVAAGLMFLTAPIVADALEFKESLKLYPPAEKGWMSLGKSIKFSLDLTHMVFIASRDKKFAVVFDGKLGPSFDAIGQETPIFSPDGKHIAYKAKKGNTWRILVGNKEQAAYENVSRPLFSPDSARVLYLGQKKDEKQCAVIDGREAGCFDSFLPNILKFSADSTRWTAIAINKKKMVAVVDGQGGSAYEDITVPIFSPDSRRVAYTAQRDKKWRIVVDGKEGASICDQITFLTFSPDSRHVYYSIQKGEKWLMVTDDKEGPASDGFGAPLFSPDGKHMSQGVLRDKKLSMISDGREEKPYDALLFMKYSPNSKKFAYNARKGKEWVMVVDAKEEKAYDLVEEPVFSSDSNHLGYVAQRGGKWFIVMDGLEGTPYTKVSIPLFSPDGRHFCYIAQKEGILVLVTDGKEGPAFAQILNVHWSSDSRHLAYFVESLNRWSVCVDGQMAKNTFDGFLVGTDLIFVTPERLRALALKHGPEFIRYEIEITK